MARPKKEKEERRDRVMPSLRVTRLERAHMDAMAAAAQVSLSDLRRELYRNGTVAARAPLADIRLIQALEANAAQINAIGHNIHQLLRLAHLHHEIDTARFDAAWEAAQERLLRIDALLEELRR